MKKINIDNRAMLVMGAESTIDTLIAYLLKTDEYFRHSDLHPEHLARYPDPGIYATNYRYTKGMYQVMADDLGEFGQCRFNALLFTPPGIDMAKRKPCPLNHYMYGSLFHSIYAPGVTDIGHLVKFAFFDPTVYERLNAKICFRTWASVIHHKQNGQYQTPTPEKQGLQRFLDYVNQAKKDYGKR